MQYFTVKEAEALLPEIKSVLEQVSPAIEAVEEKSLRLSELENGRDPAAAEIAMARAQIQFLISGIEERLSRIAEMGALPKGIKPALVDFPSRLNGRDVYLCWKQGEERIAHYHGFDAGFAGRKPLPLGRTRS